MRTEGTRPLRVLQVTNTAVGGEWFYCQVTGLAQLGHEVIAVLPAEGPLTNRVRAAGIHVEIVPLSGWRPRQMPRVVAAELKLVRLIRRLRPDIVHAHLLKSNVACRIAGLVASRPLQVSQLPGAAHLRSPILRRIDLGTLGAADVVIASCEDFARRYRQFGARSVAVSHYGFDLRPYHPTVPPEPFRREFGLDATTPTVGMLAYMYPGQVKAFRDIGVKGHEVMLDAIPHLLSLVPDAHVFIVGDELRGDGTYRRSLEDRARRLGIAGRTHFTGHRSDVPTVLAGLDVLVTPSVDESASGATVQALLMERGVVASDVGGLPDTVQHGETGLLVPPGDPLAVAEAVAELIQDPARRQELGRLGRLRCLRRFDVHRTVADIERVYRTALAGRQEATL
ncbi:glycosyltransferase family 4 protein [Micromonospora echinofusca]|uniref:glycosyltransferase family 4 protein n=1 Tax=Micromonospora echinofusca TaxID=47858 RepID=UPI0033D07F05